MEMKRWPLERSKLLEFADSDAGKKRNIFLMPWGFSWENQHHPRSAKTKKPLVDGTHDVFIPAGVGESYS